MTEPAVWSEVRPKTLAGVLRARTAERPDQWAFTFLADGETEAGRLTYAELDARATAIAAVLARWVPPGERALLLFPPGLDFVAAFFGCLYAGVVAVPAYPPRPNDRSQSRLRSIARDAEPKAALTTSAILAGVEGPKGLLAIAPELGGLRWIPTDTPDLWTGGSGRELPDPDPDSVAFLQYTSGSTSAPKGVMVTHANLVHNERMIGAAFEQDEDSVVVGWLPLYHDMGLIGNVLQPLHAGGRCVLMSPVAFLQKPLRWLSAISRYRATTSGGPNFAYELCLRKIGPEEKAGLDLSSWRVAYNGAEPVRAETLERFAQAFAPCGFRRAAFYPCYGLAEATLFVTGGEPGRFPRVEAVDAAALERHEVEPAPPESPGARLLVSCGRPFLGQRVAIVDPETGMEQPPGRVGEIWIAGESVARGYWKRDEATQRDFNAFLLGVGDHGEGPYLRTGDLGFLGEGELFVTGRLKDLIIIRGRNHYPQDVELTAERSHPDLRPGNGAAFSVEVGGEERLVLVHEVERRRREGLEEVAEAVRRAVAEEHEVQVHEVVLIRVGTLSKTSSGKVQRRLCRDLYLADELAVVGRSALAAAEPAAESGLVLSRGALLALEPEERPGVLAAFLAERVAAAVGAPVGAVSPELPLTSLGLDSLAAVELKGSVEAALGLPVPLADLLQGIGTRALAEKILEAGAEVGDVPPVRALSLPGDQPLSFGQKGLWFLERLTPGGGAYNIAVAARARDLDPIALGRALEAVVSRHEALRTVFHLAGEEPAQRALPEARVDFAVEEASAWTERELEGRLAVEAWRPFSLEEGPLVRLRVFERGKGERVLLFAVHHLVADFGSLGIVARDLDALYRQETGGPAAELPPAALRYPDFVAWQAERLAGERGARLWDFWRERLSGLPDLDLPTDRARPPVRAERGGARALALPSPLASEVRAFGSSRGATLFMTLLAAFEAQLARTSGQEDFAVGSPTAGRPVPELAGLVGYLVNTVALRADLSGEPGFGRLVERVRTTTLESLEHGDFPFPLVAERLRPARDPARSPLFQAMFVLQRGRALDDPGLAAFALGEDGARIGLGGAVLESLRIAERRAQFDLTLRVTEDGAGGLTASLEYDASLWDGAMAERMLGHFRTLLGAAVAAPETPVWHLPLLTAEERTQILEEWNETSRAYPRGLLLHERFEEQAAERPGAEALVAGDVRLTYEELNRRANRLAHHLRTLGVMPEDRVGVCLRRSERMVSTLLGILKAGGAYVPLDPAYPRERLELILTDSGARLVVTEEGTAPDLAAFAEGRARRVLLDADAERIARESSENPEPAAGTGNLAYLIYTSGSTGKPKAVAIEHRSPGVLVHWAREVFSPGDLAGVLASTSIGFDLSVFEIFVPLSWGGRVIVADNALALPALPAAGEVTLINTVPSAMAELVRGGQVPASVRVVNLAGEPIPPALVEAIHALSPRRWLYNLYGPSEDTTYSTFALLATGSEAPIGRPLADTRVYLLDARGEPVSVGVPGELYLAGEGLARGYLGRPDLTAERFVPDPFATDPGARLYRTGDLARYRASGDMDFLGRIDHQVKVRGFRVELGEIEAALARHPQVREVVVVAKDDGERGKRLVAYVTPRGVAAAELRQYLRESLPEHMVPSAFVRLSALPLSPNGKVDRKALPDPGLPGADRAPAAPRSGAEELLAGLVAEVLGVPRVGLHDDFFALGGHSLLATRLVARVARVFGVELPVSAVFVTPTVSGLAARIAQAGSALSAPPLVPVPRDGSPLPLSFAQKRLWLLDRIEPGNPAYNVPGAVRLAGPLDLAALERSLEGIVRRHEALRTVFRMDRGQPVQAVQPAAARLPLVDLSDLPAFAREAEADRVSRRSAAQPFDLWRGPLYRMLALRLAPADHLLLVTFHHIVADGWSLAVFWNELASLYEGTPLPPLPVQYPDFAVWQREWLAGEVFLSQLAWWRDRLAGLPVLELPTDHPRPAVRSFRGGTRAAFLPAGLAEALERLARRQGVTPFMALLAAFQTLLARWTGAPSIPVGSPVANRSRVETEGLLGFFVNTLVLRAEVGDDPSFPELLARVREVCLGAWAHQDLPFERLVEDLRPERHLSQNPLFQVVFLLEEPLPSRSLGAATARARRVETGTAKFDATLAVSPEDGGLAVSLEYDAALFDPQTMDRLLGHWRTLLEGIVAGAGARLSDLPLLSAGEVEQILGSFRGVAAPYPREASIHELFEAEARRDPEAVALEIGEGRLTYGELDLLANRLARRLRRAGVGLGAAVGLCVERSAALVVGMLGILKAGGAYVPLDPAYPEERLAFMAADSGLAALVTQRDLRGALPAVAERAGGSVLIEASGALDGAEESAAPLPPLAGGGDLAYVMYTSGSTGRPKGVEVLHRAVVRLVRETGYVRFGRFEAFLQLAPASFDAATFEIWGALLNGARLALFPGRAGTLEEIAAAVARHRVTTLWLTAGLFHSMVEGRLSGLAGVSQLLAGGDVLFPEAVRRALSGLPGVTVINGYGPTENTTFTACHPMRDPGEVETPVSIGTPIANTRVHLLDRSFQPVPVGVPGELFAGGDGVARGYRGRPDLTAERFVPDPFGVERGARLYRTGDLARWRPSGKIEFLGRADRQVKIRGFRIEPAEIEAALALHPEVGEAAVVVRDDLPGGRALVACAVPRKGDELPQDLRDFLRERLPEHMLPSFFVALPALPLTANGKVDRESLARLGPVPGGGEREAVLPRTPLEERLAGIWSEVLGVATVGVHDNFFELGGHSLLAVQVISRVSDALGMDLPLADLFEEPTVAGLASRLAGALSAPRETTPPEPPAPPPPLPETAPRSVPAAPRTPLEAKLAAIWSEVLGVAGVGVHDDFFDLGGHSLTAHQVAVRVAREIGVELAAQSLFEAPTVAALAERLAGLPAAPLPEDAPASGPPLSFAQHRLWLTDLLEPGGTAYNLLVAARLEGTLAPLPLARSLAEILSRHEPLRTVFPQAGGEPVQGVLPPPSAADLPLARVDLVGVARELRDEALHAVLRAEAERPFDLAHGPVARFLLVRMDPREHVLVASFHHIAADGWSMGVFFEELAALYSGSPLPDLPLSYADFALWQRREAEGEAVQRQLAWWRRELAGLPVLELPTDRPRAAARGHRGANRPFAPGADLTSRLRALAPAEGITLFVALLGGFAAVLSRWSGQGDVPVGVPSAGRNRVETEGMIGFFVNTLVLRGRMEDDPPFLTLLRRLRQTAVAAQANQDVPFDRLVEELHPHRDPGVSPLFQVMFAFLAVPPVTVRMPGLEAALLEVETRTAKFDLTLSLAERDGALSGFLEYRTELFEAATADRLLGHLTTLLEGAAADPGLRLSELPLLSEAERRQLLAWSPGEALDLPDVRLHELVLARAAESPEAPALVFEGGLLTYGELRERVERLARRLRRAGVGPEVVVGLCAERSPGFVAGVLAVWRAGGAYLPLDPSYPADRLALVLEDSGAAVLLAEERLLPALPADPRTSVVLLDGGEPEEGEAPAPVRPEGDGLAAVLYTSGSTGRPKGVMLHHRGLANRLLWAQETYRLTEEDAFLFKASLGFDVSIWEMLAPLLAGARLVIPRPGGERDVSYLARILAEKGVTIAHFVPSMLAVFLREEGIERLTSLRQVFSGGEALTPELRDRFFARLSVPLDNEYGPTEITVDATRWACAPGQDPWRVPIGRPIANTRIHLLDRGLRPVAAGLSGRLHVGGPGVARGYLGRPDLTAERFVPDPWGEGERLYDTGDLARWLPDGTLEFLGRADAQVKVRGVRIEPGEVEAALARLPGVAAAAVTADAAGARLVAYVVAKPGARAEDLASDRLRQALRATLPEAMVPSLVLPLPALPLTPYGKLDRRALPAPESLAEERSAGSPGTPAEELLSGLWSDLLGVSRVGPQDDFFALGGHSLLATQAISRVRRLFGVDLPVSALFEAPTPAALAGRIEAARGAGGPAAPPIVPVPRGPEGVPLSFAQQRLWFLDRLEPGSAAYNVPGALLLSGPLRPDVLGRALAEIVRRHEALRTVLREGAREPVQVVLPPADRPLPGVDLAGLPEPAREAEAGRLLAREARRPFDLAAGPLFRVALFRLGEEEHRLAIVLHHVISDAWSLGVMLRELGALYRAFAEGLPSPLPELPVQYADFAVWQRRWLAGEVLRREVEHWKRGLEGAPEELALPLDRPRPAVPSRPGARLPFTLPAELAAGLRILSRREGWTPFMVLLAAFEALLARLSGQRDVVVGSAVANRNRLEIEGLIGFFTNTLAFRLDLSGDPSFRTLAHRARAVTLDAHAHQDLPFEKLVEEIHSGRDLARTPVFQVMLVFQSLPSTDLGFPGVTAALLDVDPGTAKLDLTLQVAEDGEGGLAGSLEYDREIFEEATASRLLARFTALLAEAVGDPEWTLSALPLLTAAERDEIAAWNRTAAGIPWERTVHQLVGAQAALTPEAVAVEHGADRLTYGELVDRAGLLARRLSARGVGADVPVGVFLDRSIERMVAVLGVLEAGGAYLPLDPAYPKERLRLMVEDAAAPVVVTRAALLAELPALPERALLVEEDEPAPAGETPAAFPESLAYVIYTSGSTGRPKGVAMPHRALVNLLAWQTGSSRAGEGTRTLQLAPFSFDVSFQETFSTWTTGGTLVLVPEETRRDPKALLEFLEEKGVERLFLPFVALQQLAMAAEAGGSPSRLREVVTAGEQLYVTPQVAALLAALPGATLHNHYGPTETHVATSLVLAGDPAGWPERPSVGRPLENDRVFLLGPDLDLVPAGVAGELYVAGLGLARGYLGRPDWTAERFVPDPFSWAEGWEPGGRLYRTGDLARFLPDGEIELLGRRDHQVKVRGVRIELAEVEAVLARHPAVAQAAAAVHGGESGSRRLVGYVAFREGAAPAWSELKDFLAGELPDAMIPTAWVRLDRLPQTPSGKVDRRALPAPEGTGEIVPPRTPAEELLARVFREILEIPRVGASQSFFELGGHSLLAARLVSRVREVFGIEIPLRRVFEKPVLADLASEIEAAVEAGASTLAPPLRPVPHDGPLPLSFAQERLWFLDRLKEEGGGAVYNIPLLVRLRGELSVPAFAAAFREIVRRHEALRTVFPERDGEPVQVIEPPPAAWELPVVDLEALPAAWREAEALGLGEREALTVFSLDRGPLLSTTLLRLAERDHLLILNMHHIVSDGWSLGVLLADLGVLYGAARAGAPSPLPELPVQYADFAVWQRRWLSGERLAAQVEFWRRQLAGAPAVFELPADRPRPAVQTQNGARVPLCVRRELSSRLTALARRRGVTPFMLLLAAWQALLHRSTGQEDFNVGSPVAGRNRRETERLIGFFVNTLVLRADLSGNPAFEELLLRTRKTALAAYSHQDLPFEKLVDELKPARDLAHQPLVQVVFSLQNTPLGALELPGLALSPLELGDTLAKFDVTLALSEARGEIAGSVEYNTDLFDRSTIARLAAHVGVLLESIADDPARRISDLHLLTDGERHQLLLEWTDAGRSFHGVCLHQLFERQAALRPETPAAVFEDAAWSYGELDRRANQLAHFLLRLGVGPEVRVGLFVERSLDMLTGMLGVLKTGGAYVPLDPGYPRERLAFTLDDSGARVVLTQERLVGRLPETGARVVRLDADWEEISREPGESPEAMVTADDLAYVIYTSGSTGKPKGVMIPHRAVVLYVSTTSPFFGIGPGGHNMQFSSISFDASVEEIYGCITHGATLYVRGEVQEGVSELLQWMTERGITWAQLPTAFWHQLTAAMETEDLPFPPALRVLMIGGEKALAQRLVAWWKRVPEGFRFINAYGPTETTVAATLAAFPGARPVGESLLELPLGRPLSFVRAYVLDRRLRPVPIGVTGELHLGGQGLARGYLGRPDLTAEKFIPNPFAPLAGKTGERLYRTGDLVRLLPDGMLEFVGRVDDQVKIRGFRIELGEIETTLARHPNVGEAVVMAREDAPGEKHLVAYVSPRAEPAPTPEDLAAFLARQLPAYMVPGALLVLPSMPTNAHGKVDRRALAGIAPGPPRSRRETYVAPQSELESRVAAVWREIFGLEQVGVHDNFFDLGGNSLLIVKLHSRLQKALGRDFPLVDLFKHPTVAALAGSLGAVRTEKPSLDRARARTETRRESMKQLQELRDKRRKAEKGTVRKP